MYKTSSRLTLATEMSPVGVFNSSTSISPRLLSTAINLPDATTPCTAKEANTAVRAREGKESTFSSLSLSLSLTHTHANTQKHFGHFSPGKRKKPYLLARESEALFESSSCSCPARCVGRVFSGQKFLPARVHLKRSRRQHPPHTFEYCLEGNQAQHPQRSTFPQQPYCLA